MSRLLSNVHSINAQGELVFKYRKGPEVVILGVKTFNGYYVLFSQ